MSLGISNFLEEIFSLSPFIVFLYFFCIVHLGGLSEYEADSVSQGDWMKSISYKVCRQWVGMGGWLGDWADTGRICPQEPHRVSPLLISWPILKFLLSTGFTCCFPYFVFFVHLAIFAFFPAISFSLSVLLFDSFLANTVIGPFKKQATFLPFQ